MTPNNSRPEWSLTNTIRKGRQQASQKELLQKKSGIEIFEPQVPEPTSLEKKPPVTQQPTPISQTITREYHLPIWSNLILRDKLALGAAVFSLFSLVCLLVVLTASSPATPAVSPTSTIPSSSAEQVVVYLQESGVKLSNVRKNSIVQKAWTAQELIAFDVLVDKKKASIQALSYKTSRDAGVDAFTFTQNPKWSKWTLVQNQNVLVIFSPDVPSTLINDVTSHITQAVVAPYRNLLPTKTATP
jgi:hypothetical protein